MTELNDARLQHPRRNELLAALGVALLSIALFLLRYGYDYGISDQEEFLPAVAFLKDGLFATDWFVISQAGTINVRTPTVFLIAGLSTVVSTPTAVSFLFTMSLAGLAVSLFYIFRRFGSNKFLSMCGTVGALVLTPQWTLGGNDLAQSLLTPSMMAWAVALGGVALFLHDRRYAAAIMVGVAAYLQPLVSLQVGGIVFLASLIANWLTLTVDRKVVARWLLALLIYSLIVGPFLYLLLASSESGVDDDVIFEILGVVRAPHHYLFSEFPIRNTAFFLLLVVAGTAGLMSGKRRVRHAGLAGLAIILLLCFVSYIFTELIPVLTILKLQLFKSSVLGKVICIAGIVSGLSILPINELFIDRAKVHSSNRFAIACAVAGFILITSLAFFAPSQLRVGEMRTIDGMASLERWVQRETEPSAVFMIPPSNSRFRLASNRAIVVNFKAFPFQDDAMVEWRKRLESAGGPVPVHLSTAERLEALDAGYEAKTPVELNDLARIYGAKYLVKRTPLPRDARQFRTVFISPDGWRVYQVVGRDSA